MKTVDISVAADVTYEDIAALAIHYPSLTSLSLEVSHRPPDSDTTVHALSSTLRLEKLVLSGFANLTDASLAHISSLPILEVLDLSRSSCNFTSGSIQSMIQACPHLVLKIDIGQGGGFDVLKCIGTHCRYLRVFCASSGIFGGYCTVTTAAVRELVKGCPLLEELRVSYDNSNEALAIIAQFFPRLKLVNLLHGLTDQGLIALSRGCPDLREINVFHPSITDESVLCLAEHCHNMEVVTIQICSTISAHAYITLLKSNPSIKVIVLADCPQIDDQAILAIAQHCPKLTLIMLNGMPHLSVNPLITLVSRCVHLIAVTLIGCKVSDAFIDAIALHCKRMHSVSIWECSRLTERSLLTLLTHCRYLTNISFDHCGVDLNYELRSKLQICLGTRRLAISIDRVKVTLP